MIDGKELICKCGNKTFYIEQKGTCEDCYNNGLWSEIEEKYVYIGDSERTQSETEGECRMGNNYNNGCDLFSCSECGKQDFRPIYSDY